MSGIIREGDRLSQGGVVLRGGGRMFMGRALARRSDPVQCDVHGYNYIAEGNPDIRDGDLEVAEDGHRCACGCRLISSLANSGSR
ncbi:PAAR domain-containing protein [Cupriavidus pauculus]|uniref:PAAR domain-containing protein n=2 Tax=Burkholderiaceae TaxID=119060 RepID=A0A3G8H629_9BURK|nr:MULTISPECIES: PAAR domain-containing protein [Cupriavidus]AZG15645.1 PAAR domain-containing protein [Cupriavidus pauculus]MDT6962065.1 PAAR domain-containing protein [Cupriavidus sp. SZY C1]